MRAMLAPLYDVRLIPRATPDCEIQAAKARPNTVETVGEAAVLSLRPFLSASPALSRFMVRPFSPNSGGCTVQGFLGRGCLFAPAQAQDPRSARLPCARPGLPRTLRRPGFFCLAAFLPAPCDSHPWQNHTTRPTISH